SQRFEFDFPLTVLRDSRDLLLLELDGDLFAVVCRAPNRHLGLLLQHSALGKKRVQFHVCPGALPEQQDQCCQTARRYLLDGIHTWGRRLSGQGDGCQLEAWSGQHCQGRDGSPGRPKRPMRRRAGGLLAKAFGVAPNHSGSKREDDEVAIHPTCSKLRKERPVYSNCPHSKRGKPRRVDTIRESSNQLHVAPDGASAWQGRPLYKQERPA